MMDILIIAQYLSSIENLANNQNRFIYLARLLSDNEENEVEIVTSLFMHGRKQHAKKVCQGEQFKITAISEPGYKKNVCFRRIYSHWILGKNIGDYLRKRKKPDCVYCAIPSLGVAKEVSLYCKKNKVRFIIDLQDLWPESFKMAFNIPLLSNLVFFPIKKIANFVYSRADVIIAVSKTFCNRVKKVNHNYKAECAVFIGTDLRVFDENVNNNYPEYVKKNGEVLLGYCGSLSQSYDIISVIDALSCLRKQGVENIKFIIMGSGERLEEFKKYGENKNIDIIFTGSLSYPKMCRQLKECDIVVNPIVGTSVCSIINKHADYAASGLPVLNTQVSQEYCELVEKYNMGVNCKNGDPADIAVKLLFLMNNSRIRLKMGKNARLCAEELFDRRKTYGKIVQIIQEQ